MVISLIDSHCHLEQKDFSQDRDMVIEKCRLEGLKAIVTCCAHPRDFDLTMQIVEKHKGFVFATVGSHPEYVKEVSSDQIEALIRKIIQNGSKINAVGEAGLDYYWIREELWRQKQKEEFAQFIHLAQEVKKPLVVHARDSAPDALNFLEQEGAERVLMHMFGANHLTKRVVENGWNISLNTIVLRSKRHRKVARDTPLEKILLETDSPWLGDSGRRNDPTSIKIVAKEIAEIKKIDLQEVWTACARNAMNFFGLPISLRL